MQKDSNTTQYASTLLGTSPGPYKCTAARGYERFIIVVWPWIDACIYSLAPFTALVVLNVLITRQVVTARRQDVVIPKSSTGSSLSTNSTRAAPGSGNSQGPTTTNASIASKTGPRSGSAISRQPIGRASTMSSSSSSRRLLVSATGASASGGCLTESNAVQLGIILATITVAFLITTLPMTIVIIVKAFFESLSSPGGVVVVSSSLSPSLSMSAADVGRNSARLILARTVSELLMYTNHSINFFLYCAAGEKFRRELAALGRRVSHRFRPAVVQRNPEMSTAAMENQSNVVMLAVIMTEKCSAVQN